jgi:hypothetical protein
MTPRPRAQRRALDPFPAEWARSRSRASAHRRLAGKKVLLIRSAEEDDVGNQIGDTQPRP